MDSAAVERMQAAWVDGHDQRRPLTQDEAERYRSGEPMSEMAWVGVRFGVLYGWSE